MLAEILYYVTSRIYEQLELLLNIHPELLDTFPRPQIVCLGDENAGKSSILERIIGAFFPKDSIQCTKCAIRLESRYSGEVATTAVIKTREKSENGVDYHIRGEETCPIESVAVRVKQLMNTFCEGKCTSKKDIVISIKGKGYPNLDLVDLPGFFSNDEDEEQINEVKNLAASIITTEQDHSLFLLVLKPHSTRANNSKGAILVREKGLQSRTFGIVTNADSCAGNESEKKYLQVLFQPNKFDGRQNFPRQPNEMIVDLGERWFLSSSRKPDNYKTVSNSDRLLATEELDRNFWANLTDQRVLTLKSLLEEVDIPFKDRIGLKLIREKINEYYDDYIVHIWLDQVMLKFLKDYIHALHQSSRHLGFSLPNCENYHLIVKEIADLLDNLREDQTLHDIVNMKQDFQLHDQVKFANLFATGLISSLAAIDPVATLFWFPTNIVNDFKEDYLNSVNDIYYQLDYIPDGLHPCQANRQRNE
jgi:hypothetical protein